MTKQVLSVLVLGALVSIGLLLGYWLGAQNQPVISIQQGATPVRYTRFDSLSEVQTISPAQLNYLFKQAARAARQAVVFIEVETPERLELPRDRFHQFDEDKLRRFFKRRFRRSAGSGVIISAEGYIVTNHHVVDQARVIRVLLNDKREFEAEWVGSDPTTDLAVIKIDAADLQPITLGDSDRLEVGEWVLAIGNPFRLTATVTAGIVSAVGRQVGIIEDSLRIEDFIQTDAAINPGNSGGALVNLYGELVGVNTAIATEHGTYEGYGFAVPVNMVRRVVTDLIAYGEVRRGYLGVEIMAVTDAMAQRLGLGEVTGVRIARVLPGAPADEVGLKAGDVVLSVDGHPVNAPNQLQRWVALHRPGEVVTLEVWRKGKIFTLKIPLMGKEDPALKQWSVRSEEPPTQKPEAPDESSIMEVPEWGLGLRNLTPAEQKMYGVSGGAYVAYVRGDSPAYISGLPRDVVIERIENRPVSSAREAVLYLQTLASRDQPVLIQVRKRDGRKAFYELYSMAPLK